MKKIALLITTIILACAMGITLAADLKIGVFNLQDVLQKTPQVVNIRNTLKKQFEKRNNGLVAMQKKVQADILKLRKMPTTKTKARNKLQQQIIAASNSLRTKQVQLQRDVVAARDKSLHNLMAQIKTATTSVAKNKGLDLVLSNANVAYNSDKIVDVTSDIIKSMS